MKFLHDADLFGIIIRVGKQEGIPLLSSPQRTSRPLPTLPGCVEGLGFRVEGVGLRVPGSEFRVTGSASRFKLLGLRVLASGFLVQGSGFKVMGLGCMVYVCGFQFLRFRFQG